ncbi:MAG: hypothetical protein ACI841_000543 [Planctomycetota bacterium]|jgi:hypothetical protein
MTAPSSEPGSPPGDSPLPQADQRVPFRSRSEPDAQASPPVVGPDLDADGSPLPRLLSISSALLLAIVATLGSVSWSILDGYQIADSIEYMEHAQALIHGENVIDASTIRSKAFAALLTPIFLVADWLDIQDYKPVVAFVRLLLLCLGLVLVHMVRRIGARMGGAQVGWVAGLFAGTNPVFLQYTISPVADLAAAVCVAGAIDALMITGTGRRGLRGGLWLGLGMMIAYKTLIVLGVLGLLVFVRDRLRHKRYLLGTMCGVLTCVIAQIGLDRWTYGEWGASLKTYVLGHFGSLIAPPLARIGFRDLAFTLYKLGEEALKLEDTVEIVERGVTHDSIRSLTPFTWYITNLPSMLVWPVIFVLVLGLLRWLRKPGWQSSLLVLVFVVNLILMSRKGYKDYRLWIPLLAAIAPLCAMGWFALAGAGGVRGIGACVLTLLRRPSTTFGEPGFKLARKLIAVGVLAGSVALGMSTLLDRNTRKFSGYWDAMDLIAVAVEDEDLLEGRKSTVASAYHWAAYMRESPRIELIKLPHHLSLWTDYEESEKQASIDAILEKDWFIVHLPVLTTHPDLMDVVNAAFSVHAMLWDHRDFEDIGPVFVLRRGKPAGARSFFTVSPAPDTEAYRRERLLPPATHFVRDFPGLGKTEDISLLGWEYEELPGDGHGWITYHWHCGAELIADYAIVDRLTTFDERNSWHNNHAPCYGVHRTPAWKPGYVYRESWPVVAASEPYNWSQPLRPMGGAYRRGDLMPANLWMDLATFGEEGVVTGRMQPTRPGKNTPVRRGEMEGVRVTPCGMYFSKDDMVRVGRLFLPIHASTRVPDDGRPIRD